MPVGIDLRIFIITAVARDLGRDFAVVEEYLIVRAIISNPNHMAIGIYLGIKSTTAVIRDLGSG